MDSYRILILPDDDCYAMNPCPGFEAALKKWCRQGGILLYGPDCAIAERCFGVKARPHCPDAIYYQEAGIGTKEEKGIERTAFSNGQIIINHTSYPYEVQEAGEKLFQYPVNDTLLLPHSGVFVKKAEQQCV